MKNRTLKFRVWDKYKKKMYYPPFQLDFIKEGHIEVSKWLNEEDEAPTNLGCTGEDCTLGRGLILMQYVWITDKNGKEAYFGDIVKLKAKIDGIKRDYYWVIRKDDFSVPVFMANGYNDKRFTVIEFNDFFSQVGRHDFRIVGNVFENKDLLNN